MAQPRKHRQSDTDQTLYIVSAGCKQSTRPVSLTQTSVAPLFPEIGPTSPTILGDRTQFAAPPERRPSKADSLI